MNGTGVRAIETHYKGYRFRSRLEARWAVFFDALGIEWEYEREGYDLDGVWYLPDFWIAPWRAFVEIKPTMPTAEERDKCLRLALATACRCLIVYGSPGVDTYRVYDILPHALLPDEDRDYSDAEIAEVYADQQDWRTGLYHVFTQCRECDGVNLVTLSGPDCSEGFSSIGPCCDTDKWPDPHAGRIADAYNAARGARFDRANASRRKRGDA